MHTKTGEGIEQNHPVFKMEAETIKKSQRETTLGIDNLENKSGVMDISINSRIQEIEERISDAEYTMENI